MAHDSGIGGVMLTLWFLISLSSPLWLPAVFVAYAIGRKRFSMKALMLAVTIEGLSIGLALCVFRMMVRMGGE